MLKPFSNFGWKRWLKLKWQLLYNIEVSILLACFGNNSKKLYKSIQKKVLTKDTWKPFKLRSRMLWEFICRAYVAFYLHCLRRDPFRSSLKDSGDIKSFLILSHNSVIMRINHSFKLNTNLSTLSAKDMFKYIAHCKSVDRFA